MPSSDRISLGLSGIDSGLCGGPQGVLPTIRAAILAIAWLAAGTACMTIAPVPGAEQVKITKSPSDVAACRAVGNIKVPTGEGNPGGATIDRIEFRNQVVGFGRNTALVTMSYLGAPLQGIAYLVSDN